MCDFKKIITLSHGQPLLSLEDLSPFLEGGYWLLCKELVMAEPGPHISMQCVATHYCCLGVLAGVTVSNH